MIMIVSNTVHVKLNPQNVEYWRKLGYHIPSYRDSRGRLKLFRRGAKLEVRVSDLPPNSNVVIEVRCKACGEIRSVQRNQYSDVCFLCNVNAFKKEKHYKWDLTNKYSGGERTFQFHIRKSYGISLEEYMTLLKAQDYKCAICQKHQSKEARRFVVDHSHQTGKVRGLLCNQCNRALGGFKDTSTLLERAVTYLRRYDE